MKRTKDGGAIIEKTDGKFVKLTKEEFKTSRIIRDIIRVLFITFFAILYGLTKDDSFLLITIAVIFLMTGWRLKTGW